MLTIQNLHNVIPHEERYKHTYITGQSGSGKTEINKTLCLSDYKKNDSSIIIVEPHGDLSIQIAKNIEDKNSFAQIRLGTYNADKRDFTTALKYLNKAKQSGNLYANLPLAFLYYKGEGVSKDIEKSFALLQESADTDPVAAFQLARFYLQGINTKVDNEKGVKYLELAASKNIALAQDITISMYKEGLFGQPKDQKKVEYWENKRDQNIEDTNYDIYKIYIYHSLLTFY